jgi:hypothetical protein
MTLTISPPMQEITAHGSLLKSGSGTRTACGPLVDQPDIARSLRSKRTRERAENQQWQLVVDGVRISAFSFPVYDPVQPRN